MFRISSLRRTLWLCAAWALSSAAAACPAERAMTVIVPYAAGGSVDAVTRLLAREVSARLGRGVVVLNLPGASGAIAMRRLLQAPRDGCTLVSGSTNTVVLLPLHNPHAGFAPGDLQAVARTGSSGLVLVASRRWGLGEAAALPAAGPAAVPLRAGHPGVDTVQALLLEDLATRRGLPLIAVPYSGAGQLSNDLIGGQIDIAVMARPAALALVRGGWARVLGDMAFAGGPAWQSWNGWFTASGVAEAAVQPLRAALAATIASPGVQRELAEMGIEAGQADPAPFRAEIATTLDRIGQLLAARQRAEASGPQARY